MLLFNFFIPMRMSEGIEGGGGLRGCRRTQEGPGKWMIEQYVILQQSPIFVHLLAQEYKYIYRSGGLSSISGEERESETAGECYLVVVKGCPGLTARHAATPLHSTAYSTHSTLRHSVSRRPPQLLRAYCELLGDGRETIVLFACFGSLTNGRLGFDPPPPHWEGSPSRVSPC